jgi:dTMP kinase
LNSSKASLTLSSLSKSVNRSLFIVFEGGEGTGKSTQIRRAESRLKGEGRDVLVTWEPGGTPVGERIRSILLDPTSGRIDARCEALLYAAARAEHVAKVIKPALNKGTFVLCDRYWDASRAYQGAGRALGMKPLDDINLWGTDGLFPDLVFLFDIDPEDGIARVKARNDGILDRLEQEALHFHRRIREAYLYIAKRDPARYHIIDARQSIESVEAQVTRVIQSKLELLSQP